MAQTTQLVVRILSKLIGAQDLGSAIAEVDQDFSISLGNGTGINLANNVFSDRRTLLTATNEDLDTSGGLSNSFGTSLVFTKIKAIIFHGAPANTGNLVISRPASNGLAFLGAAGDALPPLKPNGLYILIDPSDAGIPVAAGTADLINVNNATGASQSYDVVIIGVTA